MSIVLIRSPPTETASGSLIDPERLSITFHRLPWGFFCDLIVIILASAIEEALRSDHEQF